MQEVQLRIANAREELRFAAAAAGGGQVVTDGASTRPELPSEDVDSYIMIGLGKGAPGETVKVDILAMTRFDVSGISIAVGVNPMVNLVGVEETDAMRTLLGIDDPEDIVKQHRGRNWQDQFVQVWVLFYRQLFGTQEADDAVEDAEEGKKTKFNRQLVTAAIPMLTPVYRLILTIPSDAKPGTQIPLDLDEKYGRYYQTTPSHRIFVESPNMFTGVRTDDGWKPSRKPQQVISGWIDVVTPE